MRTSVKDFNVFNVSGAESPGQVTMQNVRAQLSELGERVSRNGEHIIVYRQGKPFFAMVPVPDAEMIKQVKAGDEPRVK